MRDVALRVEAVFSTKAAVFFKLHRRKHLEQAVHADERAVDLGASGSADRCAGLMARNVDQLLTICIEQIAILLHQLEAIGVLARPIGLIERFAGRDDCGVDVFLRSVCSFADRFTGPRADVVVRFVVRGSSDDAIDIEFRLWKRGHRFILSMLNACHASLRAESVALVSLATSDWFACSACFAAT